MIDINIIFNNFLRELHLQPQSLQDGNVLFTLNELKFVFEWRDSDPTYIRIMLPNIDSKNEQSTNFIMKINRDFKVAKIIEIENNLWAVAESFVVSAENIDFIFNRLIKLLLDVYTAYYEQKEQNE